MQSAVYGKCIFADYNNVHKDMCAKEFMKLKECYLVSLSVQEGLGGFLLMDCRKRTRHGDGVADGGFEVDVAMYDHE